MDEEQRRELHDRIDERIGIHILFEDLGLEEVSRKGEHIYSVCPFHQGADNPTGFAWNVDKGFGYCFTHCHRSFSLMDVVMEKLNYTFPEALVYLSDLVDMDIRFNSSYKKDENSSDNRAFLNQVKRAKSFDYSRLETNEDFNPRMINTFDPYMHTVLRKEGFDHDIRDYFDVRYCRDGYYGERYVVPIDGSDGDYISFSARSILPEIELEMMNIKKYLIHGGTDKTNTLYNISRAEPYIEIQKEVIVVEGFKSVWRLHQWGYRNVVATMGSTIALSQAMLLLKYDCKIIVCGDYDEAGQKLNEEVQELCGKYTDVEVVDLDVLDHINKKDSPSDITRDQWEYAYAVRNI